MAFGLSSLFGASASVDPAAEALKQEQTMLFDAKKEALKLASDTALREGRQPTMVDYLQSALAMPTLQKNPGVIADLSGQELNGFLIRKEDLELSGEQLSQQLAQHFPAQQQEQGEQPTHKGTREVTDIYDNDCNGTIDVKAINQFMDQTKGHWKFDGASFHGVTFQPATTLEVLNNAVGAKYADITLCGLEQGEVLTIGTMALGTGKPREEFSGVKLIGNGTVRVAANCTLNGLAVENGRAELEIAPGGQVNQFCAQGETLSLKAHAGSKMFLPTFHEVNFTPDSGMCGVNMQGDIMSDRTFGFVKSNLNGMKFDQCNISGLVFDTVDMTGASFRGAQRVADCVFKDVQGIESIDFQNAHVHNVTIEHKGQRHHCANRDAVQHFQQNFAAIDAAISVGRGMDISLNNPTRELAGTEFHATKAIVSNPEAAPTPDRPGEVTVREQSGDRVSTERTTIAYGGDTGNLDSTLATARNDNKAVPITAEKLAEITEQAMIAHRGY